MRWFPRSTLRRLGDGKVAVRLFPHRRGSLLGLVRLARDADAGYREAPRAG